MLRFAIALVLAGVVLAVGSPVAAQAPPPSAAGTWSGRIDVPSSPLQISVTLTGAAGGAWTGTIDIPAQGAKGLALANVAVSGAAVSFAIAGVPGNPAFTGTISADGARIAGTFSQGGATLAFELARGAAATPAAAPARPQEPKRPFPYIEEEVTYRNDAAGITLAGTLTKPSAGGPFPAVLLITGSGAQDRDE